MFIDVLTISMTQNLPIFTYKSLIVFSTTVLVKIKSNLLTLCRRNGWPIAAKQFQFSISS